MLQKKTQCYLNILVPTKLLHFILSFIVILNSDAHLWIKIQMFVYLDSRYTF